MMIAVALLSLFAGIACGYLWFSPETAEAFSAVADFALYALIFFVGVSLSECRAVLRTITLHRFRILAVPAGILFGSLLGGLLGGIILGMEPRSALAVAGGLGWYGLAGAMITDLAGARLGSVAFLAGFFRELMAFLSIPILARFCGRYTAIAPAGANSEDTALPILLRYCGEDIAAAAVVNGLICSAAVPFLINMFCAGI